jgi:hypothetical protein
MPPEGWPCWMRNICFWMVVLCDEALVLMYHLFLYNEIT